MTENKTLAKGINVKEFLMKNMVVVILIGLILGFGLGTGGKFFSANNLVNLTTQMAINAMLSAGLTYVIILGGIDISVGSVAALAGVPDPIIRRAKEIVKQLSYADITINKENQIIHTEKIEEPEILQEENETENYIRSLDLDKLSPIEAINILYDLKNRL